ncbi:SH3 domain-containing protein [Streptomyces sp. NPDC048664]|uniref:SH3 domain-containing protein n=1 Tax=Streptomyces sp. NPDC048664 TaxID=3154505 RepID=UPI003438A55E
MIRRTLQGGLAAVVAMFALAPSAAVAAEGTHITPAPVVVTVPHHPHPLLPVPARHLPARPGAHRVHRCRSHIRHVCHARHARHVRHLRRPVRLAGHLRHTGYALRTGHPRPAAYYRHAASYRHTTYVRHTTYYRHARRLHLVTGAVRHRHGAHVVGRVVTRHGRLNVRSGPGTQYRVIGHRRHHGRLMVTCRRNGSSVQGDPRWYRLAHGKGYVSAHYVRVRTHVRGC